MASDPANGHLYVVEGTASRNSRIDEFTAWGEFVKAWGWGVKDGAGEPQTCTEQTGCLPGLKGGGAGELSQSQGIAVDSKGGIYVFDGENHRVQKFDRKGDFVLAFGGDVNKSKAEAGGASEAERNLCTATSGDVCQAGSAGAGNGQFAEGKLCLYEGVGPGITIAEVATFEFPVGTITSTGAYMTAACAEACEWQGVWAVTAG